MDVDSISKLLRSHRFNVSNEEELQQGISLVFDQFGVNYERERLLGRGRVDFFLDGGIALEVKLDGALSAVTRQIYGYAAHSDAVCVVLVTTRACHRRMPETMAGKVVTVVYLEAF